MFLIWLLIIQRLLRDSADSKSGSFLLDHRQ